ncbi:MAG: hypothetical protein Fur0023_15240 [Bacteroidia bacterium]
MNLNKKWSEIFFPSVEHSVKYNPAIDGLRGIAVGLVVLFHVYPKVFSFGFVGVDVFFVISGFLITQIIIQKALNNRFSYLEFYRNRIRRIFPAMLFVLIALYIMGYLLMFPSELKEFSNHIVWSGFFAENWRLYKEANDYWDTGAFFKPILHYWSLSIEEQYYLIWPTIIILLLKTKWRIEYGLAIIFLVDFVVPQFLDLKSAYYYSFSRFWELIAGSMAAVVVVNENKYQRFLLYVEKNALWIFLMFLLSLFLLSGTETFNYVKILFLILSTTLLLLSVHKVDKLKILSFPLLVWTGIISYSLYLWHYPVISFLKYIFGINVHGYILIIISLVLSYFSYRFIELPFRKSNSYKTSMFLLFVSLVIILVAFYTNKQHGLKNRKHLLQYQNLYSQIEWKERRNKAGELLFEKVMNQSPRTDYIKSSSTDTSKKFLLVIGDSHAAVSFPGISKWSNIYSFESILLSNSGCAPYYDKQNKKTKCDERNLETFSFITSFNKHIHAIIFISREYNNFSHFKLNHELSKYMERIHSTFRYYSHLNIPFYYVLQIPELDFHPAYCIPRPFNIIPVRPSFIDYEKYRQQKRYHSIILNIAKQYPSIHVINPESVFCDGQYCYVIKDNQLLYYDDDHISESGSYLLGKFILEQITTHYP